jgi:hypothetical protein
MATDKRNSLYIYNRNIGKPSTIWADMYNIHEKNDDIDIGDIWKIVHGAD